jgi:hypothetical protein
MRALRTFTLLIALAGASTACADGKAKAEAEAEATRQISEVQSEKLLGLFNELVDHAVKHAADCPALATAADGVVNRNINTIQMLWAAKKAKKAIPPDVQAKMDQRALELVGALRKCWDDDRVKAAFKRMKLPTDKPQ